MEALRSTCRHGIAAEGMHHVLRSAVVVEEMADEAERGYDVEGIKRHRRGGRPPMGSAASSVESVRLDPELKRALLLRAADERISVSEAIRRAIGQYLRAS
ncbi:MAG: ribbon-helix-helix domain-containing protein [Nocardioidaceae bacterium]